jgi:hypothetical protein
MIFTNSMFAWEVSFTVEDFEHGSDCQSSPMAPWQACLEGCVFFFFVCMSVCPEPD